MLVIRRRPGEAIRIGEDVEIEVIECEGNRVKLGVRAPRAVAVWRSEVTATREQNIAAAGWSRWGAMPPQPVARDAWRPAQAVVPSAEKHR
jgi:carbon storage regulator